MANARIKIITDMSDTALNQLIAPKAGFKYESVRDLSTWLQGLSAGAYAATLNIVVGAQGGAAATGSITIAGNSAQTAVINGKLFTGGTDYVIATLTAAEIAINLAAAINASTDTRVSALSAVASNDQVLLTAFDVGFIGNQITTTATGDASAAGAKLTGGLEPTLQEMDFNR